MVLVLWLACASEPGPGDPGYVNCQDNLPAPDCEPTRSCCETLDAFGGMACWYETEDGRTFDCDGVYCTDAALELVCATCDSSGTLCEG